MALLNKLFSSRKKSCNKNQQDNVCDRLFAFSKDQVRVVLFRECDFRGRKLLFDSQAVHRVPITNNTASEVTTVHDQNQNTHVQKEKYAEISNGYGYICTKPQSDFNQLGEMVFGSVAMSYRGTSYKIHSLRSPHRLMYTQVFPSPRGAHRSVRRPCGQHTAPSNSSFEQSARFDDSGASSNTSMSEQLSFNSTSSDTLLVCRGRALSMPLDVPVLKSPLASPPSSSIVADSGFCGEQSFGSFNSVLQSLSLADAPALIGGGVTVSSGSLYKRWLRSTSTSLEHSGSHINSSASADECIVRSHPKSSKLGLAVIIHLTAEQDENMSHFLMEHAAVLESMVWRARQGAELAYLRSHNFVSLMHEMSGCVAQSLLDLFSAPHLSASLWLSLSSGCDRLSSISKATESAKNATKTDGCATKSSKCNSEALLNTNLLNTNSSGSSTLSKTNSLGSKLSCSCDAGGCVCDGEGSDRSGEFTFSNIMRFIRSEGGVNSDRRSYGGGRGLIAEKFITELCELLESVDVKHTNFFISTLVTAVLTHHLGWVSTVLPQSQADSDFLDKLNKPYNALWGQLADLYGAVGHPTKMAHTVITGTNKGELISKILNSLTYFIRCCDMERQNLIRADVKTENAEADKICYDNSCIPKENYKKYEDHLREMVFENCRKGKNGVDEKLGSHNRIEEEFLKSSTNLLSNSKKLGLTKTVTCSTDLCKVDEENCGAKRLYPHLETLCKDELETCQSTTGISPKIRDPQQELFVSEKPFTKFELSNSEIQEKVNRLLRVPTSAVQFHLGTNCTKECLLKYDEQIVLPNAKKECIEKQTRSNECCSEKKDVVFVLGDDEKLVGLKKGSSCGEFNNFKKDLEGDKTDDACGKSVLASGKKLGMKKEKSCFDFSNYQENDEDCCERENKVSLTSKGDFINLKHSKLIREDKSSLENKENVLEKATLRTSTPSKERPTFLNLCAENLPHEQIKPISQKLLKGTPEEEIKREKSSFDLSSYQENSEDCLQVKQEEKNFSLASEETFVNLSHSKNTFTNASNVGEDNSSLENKETVVPPKERPKFLNLNPEKEQPKPATSKIVDDSFENSPFKDSQFTKYTGNSEIKPSISWASLKAAAEKTAAQKKTSAQTPEPARIPEKEFTRSQSVPPEERKPESSANKDMKSKYRYSGVKFNFQQYPQIVTNYMKSKNIELSNLPFAEKKMDCNHIMSLGDGASFDFNSDGESEEMEALQTPSNASELECISDLATERQAPKSSARKGASAEGGDGAEHGRGKSVAKEETECKSHCCKQGKGVVQKMKVVALPMPKSVPTLLSGLSISYTTSLMRGVGDHYISDMVLQGTLAPKSQWESALRNDLVLAAKHPLLDQPVEEAVAIIANTDTWEVQLMSSHTYVVDKGSSGLRVGMSQLVANMLESLLHMWRLHAPAEHCLMHIEQRLQEFCVRSKALSQLLLATEFCNMEFLTSALQLEVNDVPLLMAVASTHSPQVTEKYGLSFQ